MSVEDRVRWDRIFRKRANEPFPAPDPLLLQYTPVASPEHRALDLASGVGQNGLWLAEQGYHTDVMDVSRVALKQARTEMALRNLRNLNILQQDLDQLVLQADTYHLICVFRYLKHAIFPIIQHALRSGGRIIYETYNVEYVRIVPGFNRDFLLKKGELPKLFEDWRIIHHDDSTHVTTFVAVKP